MARHRMCSSSCLSCFLVCSLQPCGHLLGRTDLLYIMFYCVCVTFPCGVLGQVLYLIVSIPDRCLITYFDQQNGLGIIVHSYFGKSAAKPTSQSWIYGMH